MADRHRHCHFFIHFYSIGQGVSLVRPLSFFSCKNALEARMKEFAFYMSPYEMAYFGSIIKNLPKEFVDVHVGSLDGKISDFSALAAEYRKQIDQFAAEGYSVLPLNPDMLDNYRAAAMSTEFYGPATKLFDWEKRARPGWPRLSTAHTCPWIQMDFRQIIIFLPAGAKRNTRNC